MTSGIAIISQVLSLCGVGSIRMFPSIFLYFFAMRLTRAYPDCSLVPEFIRQQAIHTPDWQVSTVFLTILGVLAVVELAAMRYPDIKEFLVEDFDRYAKPLLSILLVFDVVNNSQIQNIKDLFDGASNVKSASFGSFTLIMMVMAGFVTWFCCRIRTAALGIVHAIDPEDDLKLQSVSNYLGEIAMLVILLALVFFPPLALILTGIGMLAGVLFQRLWARYERKHSHACTACAAAGRESQVSDCALICPDCGAEQTDVRRVGWFGFSGSLPLEGMSQERHAFRLLAAHRCRWCASPLGRDTVCSRCGHEQWTEEMKAYYVRQTDMRGGLLLLLALGCFAFPVGGLALVMVFFRPFVVRPLSVHLNASGRFLTGLVTMFLKLLVLVPLVFISIWPGVGLLALLPFVGRYFYVRSKFFRAIERKNGKTSGVLEMHQ